MPLQPKIEPLLLERHDALQVHRAGLDDDADDREHQRQLVGDELRRRRAAPPSSEYLLATPSRP